MKTTITCATPGCGTTFEWEILSGFTDPSNLMCDACEERLAQSQRQAAEDEKRKLSAMTAAATMRELEAATPERYRGTRLDHPEFNLRTWESAKHWRPSPEELWIGFTGAMSGGCKTRMAFLLLHDILAEGRFTDFEIATSYEVKKLSLAQYRKDEDARERLDRLATCGLLLLDDIGKAKHSPAVAEELFTIIDHRYANLLPMIWTSNCHPGEFAADIADKELAGPLVGRIMECSVIVDLN